MAMERLEDVDIDNHELSPMTWGGKHETVCRQAYQTIMLHYIVGMWE